MLVKTINQFGRHIPSAGGHEGGEVQALGGPPPLFQTVVWAPEEEDRPGLSGVRRPSRAAQCLRPCYYWRKREWQTRLRLQPRPAVAHSQSLYFCREQRDGPARERNINILNRTQTRHKPSKQNKSTPLDKFSVLTLANTVYKRKK